VHNIMVTTVERNSSIGKIIHHEGIITYFQPIISVKKKSVIGVEALSRGVCPDSGGILPPNTLFNLAAENNLALDLDRLCRQKAMENFNSLGLKNRDIILSKHKHMRYQAITNHILDILSAVGSRAYNVLLKDLINRYSNLECIYLLDEQGIQISARRI